MWIGIVAAVAIVGLYIYAFGEVEEREEKYDEENCTGAKEGRNDEYSKRDCKCPGGADE